MKSSIKIIFLCLLMGLAGCNKNKTNSTSIPTSTEQTTENTENIVVPDSWTEEQQAISDAAITKIIAENKNKEDAKVSLDNLMLSDLDKIDDSYKNMEIRMSDYLKSNLATGARHAAVMLLRDRLLRGELGYKTRLLLVSKKIDVLELTNIDSKAKYDEEGKYIVRLNVLGNTRVEDNTLIKLLKESKEKNDSIVEKIISLKQEKENLSQDLDININLSVDGVIENVDLSVKLIEKLKEMASNQEVRDLFVNYKDYTENNLTIMLSSFNCKKEENVLKIPLKMGIINLKACLSYRSL